MKQQHRKQTKAAAAAEQSAGWSARGGYVAPRLCAMARIEASKRGEASGAPGE